LISELSEHNLTISVEWIRGYSGISGNERADQLAKEGADSNQEPCYNMLNGSKIKAVIRKRSLKLWNDENWTQTLNGATARLFSKCARPYRSKV
jgi:hypothetical protein